MFDGLDLGRRPREASHLLSQSSIPKSLELRPPAQTDSKSRLIAEYLQNFLMVTRGGLYIDGFAAPQKRDREDAWTARRVLEISPPRLRCHWLCDMDPEGVAQLRQLRDKHHNPKKQRRVFVYEGDFNRIVKQILRSDRLTRKAAIFALLDQRTAECHWETVRALAARTGRHKIEQLYFFPTSWIHRSIKTSIRPERLSEIDNWWGGDGWRKLADISQTEAVKCMAQRFVDELGYPYVNFHPIFQDDKGKKTAFHLIHASSHPDAPKLMSRAYVKIVGDIQGAPSDSQKSLGF
ncbi:MAG: three-Cys-motif partner protein TcmP [Rhodobacteraceae bacterium]|nr:three-Cys-motif partner protein TcmP [Paracoccaceae bacterium]